MMISVRALVASLGLVACTALDARAVVQLIENADSGGPNVTGHTTGSYALIQSDVVGQGTHAFHLASPAFADNWFEINQNITIQPGSRLFFLSQLGYAGAIQTARVQMSTNGGSTWPTSLYSQAGANSGTPIEGSFSLRTIDLTPYVNQSARFRFYYDVTPPGSGYSTTEPGVGWYVDNIQIADQFQKSQYSIGNPSAFEQQYLEYVNRARADAMVEANRLANEADPEIQQAYAFFGITGPEIVSEFAESISSGAIALHAQPLAFNAALNQAASLHTQDMFNNQFQGHFSSNNPPALFAPGDDPQTRMTKAGYNGTAFGENVYSNSESVRYGHAGFDVDWGGGGFQNPPGHRISIHNPDFKEIGIGVINETNGSVGPQLVTQDFGAAGNGALVTGVVYQDLNANSFYDIGEGRGGVRIDVGDSGYFAISTASGGYAVPASGNGTFPVTFSGGGFGSFSTTASIVGGANVKIDYKASAATYAADFDGNGVVNALDLADWKDDFGLNGDSSADADADSDGADFLEWQREFGSGGPSTATSGAVPEPGAAILAMVALTAFATRRQSTRR